MKGSEMVKTKGVIAEGQVVAKLGASHLVSRDGGQAKGVRRANDGSVRGALGGGVVSGAVKWGSGFGHGRPGRWARALGSGRHY